MTLHFKILSRSKSLELDTSTNRQTSLESCKFTFQCKKRKDSSTAGHSSTPPRRRRRFSDSATNSTNLTRYKYCSRMEILNELGCIPLTSPKCDCAVAPHKMEGTTETYLPWNVNQNQEISDTELQVLQARFHDFGMALLPAQNQQLHSTHYWFPI